jgi:hypothetical protein
VISSDIHWNVEGMGKIPRKGDREIKAGKKERG